MFITKKTHRQITESLGKSIMEKDAHIERLKQDIREARDLKLVLEKLAASGASTSNCFTFGAYGAEIVFPDTVAQYVPDVLGGNVIKQEATKAIVISGAGNVEIGFTRTAPDEGYSYKLIRKP
jgi:hypothetical protein